MHRLQITYRQAEDLSIYTLLRGATSYRWQRIERRLAERLLAGGLASIAADPEGVVMLTRANTFTRRPQAEIHAQQWANHGCERFDAIDLGDGRFAVVAATLTRGVLVTYPDSRVVFHAEPKRLKAG